MATHVVLGTMIGDGIKHDVALGVGIAASTHVDRARTMGVRRRAVEALPGFAVVRAVASAHGYV